MEFFFHGKPTGKSSFQRRKLLGLAAHVKIGCEEKEKISTLELWPWKTGSG